MIRDQDRHGALTLQRRIAALAASAKCALACERYQSWLGEMDAHLAATGDRAAPHGDGTEAVSGEGTLACAKQAMAP